jgi:hypothetical protein
MGWDRMRSRRRLFGLVLFAALITCAVSCGLVSIYQATCSFDVEPSELTVHAGDTTNLMLFQWDCVLSYLGFHACYEVASAQTEGLPPGSAVEGIEWLGCHESELTISTQPTTPPGAYRLTVRLSHGWAPVERVTLRVLAP